MIAQTLSLLGDQLLAVGLPLYLFDRTGSTALTAAAGLARMLPLALLGAVGGAVADRVSRRPLLVGAGLARAFVVPGLLIAVDGGPLAAVFVVSAALGVMSQLTGPAVGASLPTVLTPDDLPKANARLASRTVVVQLLAPTAGAFVYAQRGLTVLIAANSVLYLLAAATWWRVRFPALEDRSTNRLWRDTREGFRRIRRDPVLRPLLVATTVSLVGLSMELGILVPYLREVLDASPLVVGSLTSAEAVGGLVGAAVLPWLQRRLGTIRLLSLGMLGLPTATVGFLVSRSAWQALPGVVLAGLLLTLLTAGLTTYVQLAVERAYLGRTLGIISSSIGLAALAGAAAGAALSTVLPLRACLGVAVVLEVAGVLLYLVRRGPQPQARPWRHQP